MKTITLKADEQLDETISRLARNHKKTKSAVIREAIVCYELQLRKDALRQQVRAAAALVREQSLQTNRELEDSIGDGL
ncbi:MAG: ribbon-helix-helix protein, CopG family [Proteobacteria bacterium]|jgi:predicted transcriptional regulator|nr:ribbon-helix-helix protein, CopG family [Pseudomonadota bacterium]MDA1301852.1 ribbon-helix-helix protein, CopG family [Pseudomonadota bacterium]